MEQLLYVYTFGNVPGSLTCVYDSEAHGVASDHRADNISAPGLKGQLTSTLQKDLLPFLEHISALQEAQ